MTQRYELGISHNVDDLAHRGFIANTEEAQMAADLASILTDLRHVEWGICKILSLPSETEHFDPLRIALIDSVVIRYRRCFASGIRSHLEEYVVEQVAPKYLETHRYFWDLGNKHIAHSVSAAENMFSIVILDEDQATNPKVWGSVVMHVVGLEGTDDLRPLGELARVLACEYVQPEADRLSEVFHQQAMRMEVNDVLKLKPADFPVNLNADNIGKKRKP